MSRSLTELKIRVIEYLGGLSDFENAAVVEAYPEKQRSFPLKKPVITVETSGLDLSPAGLGSYLGGDSPLYGAFARVVLRFSIYCEDAAGCGRLFESLCNALLDFTELGVIKISCEKLAYDSKVSAYLLSAETEIKTAWVLEKPGERLFDSVDLMRK